VPRDLPMVLANRGGLQQVLRNLIENAVRHAAAARWVGARSKVVPFAGKVLVEIRIEDLGPGIDSVDLPNLFKPFYRGRNAQAAGIRGNGLGLHLAHERVKAMGGSIHAENRPEGGAAFVVRLPAAREDASPHRTEEIEKEEMA